MKRKLALIVLALTCVIACVFGLTACGDSGSGGGGDDNKPDSLLIVDSKGVEHNEGYDLGTFVYGTNPDFNSFKLYAKYSDGTKTEISKTDSNLTVTYTLEYDNLDALANPCEPGYYLVTYQYQNRMTTATFEVVTTATASPYELSLDKTTWTYIEEPEITVKKGGTELEESKYDIYYITVEEYNEIKDAADFKDKLTENGHWYFSSSVEPGSYYFYATVGTHTSKLVSVTIEKAAITPVIPGALADSVKCSSFRWDKGTFGKIKISSITIYNSYEEGKAIKFKDANDEEVTGYFQWANPDEEIDCSNNGEMKSIKFIPSDKGYAEYLFTEKIELTVEKYDIELPDFEDEKVFYSDDGHAVALSQYTSEWVVEAFQTLTTITLGGETLTIGDDRVLKTLTEIGTYTFKFELKDKVNYCWRYYDYDNDYDNGYAIVYDTEDKTVEYQIKARESWFKPFSDYNYNIDENRQVTFKIEQGTVYESNNSSPYKKGTLKVEILSEYSEPNWSTPAESEISATVKVETRADGYDYIVITVTSFNDESIGGRLILKATATGDDHYDDISRSFPDVFINKYKSDKPITCPLDGKLDNDTLTVPAGTTVGELYEAYPELINLLGKWVLEMKDQAENKWVALEDDTPVPAGAVLKCRLRFVETEFVLYWGEVEPYEFTLIGTQS